MDFDPNLHPFLFTFALLAAIVAVMVIAGTLGDRSYAAKGAGWRVRADDAERRRILADAEAGVRLAELRREMEALS